jgi:hypothetical protein
MNIVIIGDSWGAPNYSTDLSFPAYAPPKVHTEYRLRNLGYNVFNFSITGGTMIDTIEYAMYTLKNQEVPIRIIHRLLPQQFESMPKIRAENVDWIVWFHTEAIRDQLLDHIAKYVKLEEHHTFSSHLGYRAFAELVKLCPQAKTAVIGGQAIIDPILYQYHKPNFVIEDWRSEIVGKKLPRCISLGRLEYINTFYDSNEEKLKTFDVHTQIFDAMNNADLFFDRCHPGSKPHELLTQRLHEVFSQNKI